MPASSKNALILTLVAAALFLGGCGSDEDPAQPDPTPEVIVYGADTCGFTVALKSELDDASLSYLYKDVDIQSNLNEMWGKVFDAPWYESGNSMALPIVEVKDVVLERPSLQEITELM